MRPPAAWLLLLLLLPAPGLSSDCSVTGQSPRTPERQLQFCTMFPEESCCLNAHDSEIQGFYEDLLNAGPVCSAIQKPSKAALRRLFCYGCNPDERRITDQDSGTIFICNDLVQELDPRDFDDCGIVVPGERGNLCEGDDPVVPGNAYDADNRTARVQRFLDDDNAGKPPFFEGFTVKLCTTSAECADCYSLSAAGRSAPAGGGLLAAAATLACAAGLVLGPRW